MDRRNHRLQSRCKTLPFPELSFITFQGIRRHLSDSLLFPRTGHISLNTSLGILSSPSSCSSCVELTALCTGNFLFHSDPSIQNHGPRKSRKILIPIDGVSASEAYLQSRLCRCPLINNDNRGTRPAYESLSNRNRSLVCSAARQRSVRAASRRLEI